MSFVSHLLLVCSQWFSCSISYPTRSVLCSLPAVSVFPVDQLFHCYRTHSFNHHLLWVCSQCITCNCSPVTLHSPLFPTCCEGVPSGLIVSLLPYTQCPLFYTCCECVPSGLTVPLVTLHAVSFVPHLLWVCSQWINCSTITLHTLNLFLTCCACVPRGFTVPLLHTQSGLCSAPSVSVFPVDYLHVTVFLLPYTVLCSSPAVSVFPMD